MRKASNHPIVASLPETWDTSKDELYRNIEVAVMSNHFMFLIVVRLEKTTSLLGPVKSALASWLQPPLVTMERHSTTIPFITFSATLSFG